MSKAKYYSGKAVKVVFENPPFYIVKMRLDSDDPDPLERAGIGTDKSRYVTIKGNILGMKIKKGDWFGFEATWTEHKKYGRQLSLEKAPVFKDGFDPRTAINMMVANGAGRMLCEALYNHFGEDFIDALEDPEKLRSSGVAAPAAALVVSNIWCETKKRLATISGLGDLGIGTHVIKQVWERFGSEATRKIQENPWVLASFSGVDFSALDSLARRVNMDHDSPGRLRGAILYTLRGLRGSSGSVGFNPSYLYSRTRILAPCSEKEFVDALFALRDSKSVAVDRVGSRRLVYEPGLHHMEKESARLLRERVREVYRARNGQEEIDLFLSLMEQESQDTTLEEAAYKATQAMAEAGSKTLSHEQCVGIANALICPVSILTGLPGTGKTTSMLVLVNMLRAMEVPFLLLAPTGIAAKKLSMATQEMAYTVHRAFCAKRPSRGREREVQASYEGLLTSSGGGSSHDGGLGQEWGYGEDSKHPAQVVIIDESSMLDANLLYRILKGTSDRCRLVFVGDAAQLPSVGPGNVLRDLINSKQFPTVKLEKIFRQEDTSDIVPAAHDIHAGKIPPTPKGSDFSLLPIHDEDQIVAAIVAIARRLKERGEEFQVISPRHRGTLGVTNLNACLREHINPDSRNKRQVSVSDWNVREGDRVMVMSNDYKLGVYNGDVGKVVDADTRKRIVTVKVYDNPPKHIELDFADIHRLLRMAYACTVHKVQGLEYDTIVMPITHSFRHQLQRNLLYTAVTRARERVILVGEPTAFNKAVRNDREDLRETGLVERLREEFSKH